MDGFNQLDVVTKEVFMRQAADFLGTDLKQRLNEAIVVSNNKRTTATFVEDGDFLDEADLSDKYAKKPEQLARILETARSFIHPTRGVRVYQDAQYAASVCNVEEQVEERKRKVEQESIQKAAKPDRAGAAQLRHSGRHSAGGICSLSVALLETSRCISHHSRECLTCLYRTQNCAYASSYRNRRTSFCNCCWKNTTFICVRLTDKRQRETETEMSDFARPLKKPPRAGKGTFRQTNGPHPI